MIKSTFSWVVLPSKHHCLSYFFTLTLLQNLNSIPHWTSLFEIQLCWQSCIRLRLQCTSTLSHVLPHQQPVSLRCYTFFVCLPFSFCSLQQPVLHLPHYETESQHKNNEKLCHYISYQINSLLSCRGRTSISGHILLCVYMWVIQRQKHAQKFPQKQRLSQFQLENIPDMKFNGIKTTQIWYNLELSILIILQHTVFCFKLF